MKAWCLTWHQGAVGGVLLNEEGEGMMMEAGEGVDLLDVEDIAVVVGEGVEDLT